MAIRIKELWQRWRKDFWRLFRFGITGTICSLIHYGIYCLFLLFTNTTIAYTAGYGAEQPSPDLKPFSTLIFTVELLGIEKAPEGQPGMPQGMSGMPQGKPGM